MHIYTVSLIHVPTKCLKILWGVKWAMTNCSLHYSKHGHRTDGLADWLTSQTNASGILNSFLLFWFVNIFHMFTFNCRSDVIIFVRLRRSQKVKEKTHYFKVKNDVESIKVMSTELIPFCTCVVFWHRQVMLYEKD